MHPCFRVDVVVRLVASELVASGWGATAVDLACCCKNFEDPALDALWETQNEVLNPLLGTLPEDVWNPDPQAPFKRLPTEKEWARFQGYARRIRTLDAAHPDPQPSRILLVLQFRVCGEPLFPNLKSLRLFDICETLIPFIPLFLSPKTTSIVLDFFDDDRSYPTTIGSMIAALPTFCPSLQRVCLQSISSTDPAITTAVSGMLLALNRNILQKLEIDIPLTEEAREVFRRLPNLQELRMDIDGSGSLPTLVLPNLTKLDIQYNDERGWLQGFRGATFGKLTSVSFRICPNRHYEVILGNFLEAFESVALTTSIPATLSEFTFWTQRPWRPNYRSLLPFTQLKKLSMHFDCSLTGYGCLDELDDDIITDLARAMPKLEVLQFGTCLCWTPTSVTTKGLAALARYCPRLSSLSIHFKVSSLDPSKIPRVTPGDRSTMPPEDCALRYLNVGIMSLPKKYTSKVTRTLLRIFPRLDRIGYVDQNWKKVAEALRASRRLEGRSEAALEDAAQP